MPTTRVHCRKKEFDVYCGRPSEWGNPYSWLSNTLAKYKCKDRKEAIEKFRECFLSQPELIQKAKEQLKGKRLGCFCDPNEDCHLDVIIEVIDNE